MEPSTLQEFFFHSSLCFPLSKTCQGSKISPIFFQFPIFSMLMLGTTERYQVMPSFMNEMRFLSIKFHGRIMPHIMISCMIAGNVQIGTKFGSKSSYRKSSELDSAHFGSLFSKKSGSLRSHSIACNLRGAQRHMAIDWTSTIIILKHI